MRAMGLIEHAPVSLCSGFDLSLSFRVIVNIRRLPRLSASSDREASITSEDQTKPRGSQMKQTRSDEDPSEASSGACWNTPEESPMERIANSW
jgi:hypothetical protein